MGSTQDETQDAHAEVFFSPLTVRRREEGREQRCPMVMGRV